MLLNSCYPLQTHCILRQGKEIHFYGFMKFTNNAHVTAVTLAKLNMIAYVVGLRDSFSDINTGAEGMTPGFDPLKINKGCVLWSDFSFM